MKPSQIAVGGEYEDQGMQTIRTVTAMRGVGAARIVFYTERPATPTSKPLYWGLRRPNEMPLAEFASWAARPAGSKKMLSEKKFGDWLRGPTDRLARSR